MIFTNILMIFGIKEKSITFFFYPYNVLLVIIATNTPAGLKTGFVLQGHICLK